MKRYILIVFVLLNTSFVFAADDLLFEEDFSGYKSGLFSSGVVGAHAEYHYIHEVAPRGNWVVSSFRSNGSQRAWRVLKQEDSSQLMYQSYTSSKNEKKYTHPMIVAGDDLWQNYKVSVIFSPESKGAQSGFVFRYQNDRCYYFAGVDGNNAILKKVQHASAFRSADETMLAKAVLNWKSGEWITASVTVTGHSIRVDFGHDTVLQANDDTFTKGKIGLLSDIPTKFKSVKVTTTLTEQKRLQAEKHRLALELATLRAGNPKPVLWKKIETDGFGVGRNVRFGDLNGDGQIDVLIGQVKHHGPKDRNSELSCLTAMTFDGDLLWQIGQPDLWKDMLTNDVAFQIHDIDNDGRNEVVYCMGTNLIVADAATGKTRYQSPTPVNRSGPPHDAFPRILGDCLYFFDSQGAGYDGTILIKDRYKNFTVLDNKLNVLWEDSCKTGHYPFAYDVDKDGKDELAIGYSLFDDDGTMLWSLDDKIKDHCDGVAVVNYSGKLPEKPVIMNAASDEGMIFCDINGTILKHYYLGHVQNPAVADFRRDLPGLETVSINFWGNQGIVNYFDANGDLYYDFEPCQHGSMMLPINWTGEPEEYYVLSANVEEGGLFDGWGRKVVEFPGDGHPDLCYAVLDITGDCRDEIVVWDAGEMWVYTQDNNPKSGTLYKPIRNPLYNYSNYQATVSLPGWSE